MMRASGVAEFYVTGGASDYEKTEALCRVLPLWSGHPYYAATHELLRRLFGIHEVLNPQNLPEIWHQTAKLLFESPLTPADLPRMWGIKQLVTSLPKYELEDLSETAIDNNGTELHLYLRDMIQNLWYPPYEAPLSGLTPAEDMVNRVDTFVDHFFAKGCTGITVDLSMLDEFMRPDPYTPSQAILRLQNKKRPLEAVEQRLIITQTVRLLGGACVKRGLKLTILRTSPDVTYPLCSYLHGCGCLPSTTVAVSRPYDLSSLGITPMLYLHKGVSPELLPQELTVLASEMPLGSLGGLYMPICAPLDLPTWAEAGRTLCECVVGFGETGRGTRDIDEQSIILQHILG